jgi:CheY-like chemotaxis protein
MVTVVQSSGETLLAVINDMLDFSKIEAGKLDFEIAPFDLAYVVTDVCELLSAKAREKRLELSVDFPASISQLAMADASRVRQCLLNLVGNAIKFTSQGWVRVTVRTQLEPASDPARSCFLKVSVTDSGIGIPQDKQGLLFQMFVQADASTTRKYGGTGLGLAISRRLIERMGGKIGLVSEAGKGAEFWFTLPAATAGPVDPDESGSPPKGELARLGSIPDPAPSAARPEPGNPIRRRTPRVLLAEDNPTNRLLAETILNNLGCSVDVANDGREVVRMANDVAYDLILMDCQMPYMDGFEATTVLRMRESRGPRTPIVAVTASAMVGDREKCLGAGMDDYVTKPFRCHELAEVLQRWVSDREVPG